MSKWLLCHSTAGYDIIQECDLKSGIAFQGNDVDYDTSLGARVTGDVVAVDKSKKRMKEEMIRLRGMSANTDANDGQESDTGSVASSAGRRTRSSSTASAAGGSSQRAPTPRPSLVGKPPLTSSRLKRPATGAAQSSTPRRAAPPPRPQPLMRGLTGVSTPLSSSGILPAQGVSPLVHSSLLPQGFSLSGTPPLTLPATNDEASFRQFMMTSMVSLHSELSGVKAMVNNLYLGWNNLVVQTANRTTSTHMEVSGTRDRLSEVENAVKNVETQVQEISTVIVKTNEFTYAPYSTKEEIDLIDNHQVITTLATDVERIIYDKSNPNDAIDLCLPHSKRTNKAKAKWHIELLFHRRMVSTAGDRPVIQKSIIDRLNNYAGRRRRAREIEERAQSRDSRLSVRGGESSKRGRKTVHMARKPQNADEIMVDEEGMDGMGLEEDEDEEMPQTASRSLASDPGSEISDIDVI